MDISVDSNFSILVVMFLVVGEFVYTFMGLTLKEKLYHSHFKVKSTIFCFKLLGKVKKGYWEEECNKVQLMVLYYYI